MHADKIMACVNEQCISNHHSKASAFTVHATAQKSEGCCEQILQGACMLPTDCRN